MRELLEVGLYERPSDEPFLFSVLCALQASRIDELKHKAKLTVERSCRLRGVMDELAPTDPICVPALRAVRKRTPRQQVQLQLYSYTRRDGTDWHYEWLSASSLSAGGGRPAGCGVAASPGARSAS